MDLKSNPDFLYVKPGDYVAIKSEKDSRNLPEKKAENYWIGQVISCIGGARDPKAWTLFQVMDIDSGEIMVINADAAEKILKTSGI